MRYKRLWQTLAKRVYISAKDFLTVGCTLFVCLCDCLCGVRVYVHVDSYLWSLDEGTRNWNTRTVCHLSVHPRTLSYEAREAYVHVTRLDFIFACVYVFVSLSTSLYNLLGRGIECVWLTHLYSSQLH